jgi:hypothetical protein
MNWIIYSGWNGKKFVFLKSHLEHLKIKVIKPERIGGAGRSLIRKKERTAGWEVQVV